MPGLEEYELFDDGHDVVMEGEQQYVTMTIAVQLFGVPIMQVEDIVEPDRITMVPLTSKKIAGVMNLRGRVVTVIDLRQCLGPMNGNGSAPALQAPAANENSRSDGTPEEVLTQNTRLRSSKFKVSIRFWSITSATSLHCRIAG